jgi:hypothetical protein
MAYTSSQLVNKMNGQMVPYIKSHTPPSFYTVQESTWNKRHVEGPICWHNTQK